MRRLKMTATRAEFLALRLVTAGRPFRFSAWGAWHCIDVTEADVDPARSMLAEAGWRLDSDDVVDVPAESVR